MRDRLVWALAATVSLHLFAARAQALSVTPMSLAEAVADAGCIVHGTVVDVRSGRDDGGLPATWVTVRVADLLKGGAPSGEVRFKQFGVAAPTADGRLPMPFLPRFRSESEVVLLLRPPSRSGFTSPVDPRLGYYVVTSGDGARDAGGAAAAGNGVDRVALERLLATLQRLVEEQR